MDFFRKQGRILFCIALLFHCLCIYFDWGTLRIISKLVLLPTLILLLFATLQFKEKAGSPWVYLGLVFSFFGDLLLTQTGEKYFLLGMLAFIGTHICNSIYFIHLQPLQFKNGRAVFGAAILLTFIILLIFQLLNPYLGNFRVPIIAYMIIISIMVLLAVNTTQAVSLKNIGLTCFIPGAALFVCSDGILALNKFLFHQPLFDILVMFSYGGAQYFLVQGFVKTK